jgi:hypothetical protein
LFVLLFEFGLPETHLLLQKREYSAQDLDTLATMMEFAPKPQPKDLIEDDHSSSSSLSSPSSTQPRSTPMPVAPKRKKVQFSVLSSSTPELAATLSLFEADPNDKVPHLAPKKLKIDEEDLKFDEEDMKNTTLQLDPKQDSPQIQEPPQPKRLTLDKRNIIPGFLKEFKAIPFASKTSTSPRHKFTTQEFRCRDCKKAYCRRGDRDNHEVAMGHEKWREGKRLQLSFD